jgi:hypothetical protein
MSSFCKRCLKKCLGITEVDPRVDAWLIKDGIICEGCGYAYLNRDNRKIGEKLISKEYQIRFRNVLIPPQECIKNIELSLIKSGRDIVLGAVNKDNGCSMYLFIFRENGEVLRCSSVSEDLGLRTCGDNSYVELEDE